MREKGKGKDSHLQEAIWKGICGEKATLYSGGNSLCLQPRETFLISPGGDRGDRKGGGENFILYDLKTRLLHVKRHKRVGKHGNVMKWRLRWPSQCEELFQKSM